MLRWYVLPDGPDRAYNFVRHHREHHRPLLIRPLHVLGPFYGELRSTRVECDIRACGVPPGVVGFHVWGCHFGLAEGAVVHNQHRRSCSISYDGPWYPRQTRCYGLQWQRPFCPGLVGFVAHECFYSHFHPWMFHRSP